MAIIGGRWLKRQWLDLSASLALDPESAAVGFYKNKDSRNHSK
jgi:hypothetical protein